MRLVGLRFADDPTDEGIVREDVDDVRTQIHPDESTNVGLTDDGPVVTTPFELGGADEERDEIVDLDVSNQRFVRPKPFYVRMATEKQSIAGHDVLRGGLRRLCRRTPQHSPHQAGET